MMENTQQEFGKHPTLTPIYKGYQGCKPEDAKIIIIGRDANFDKDIDAESAFFKDLATYFSDGKAYTLKHQFHHPSLNFDGYNGEIEFIHGQVNFAFSNKDASRRREMLSECCFIDLLYCPTYGKGTSNRIAYSQLLRSEENLAHLAFLDSLLAMPNKTFFMFFGVYSIISERKLLKNIPPPSETKIDQWYTNRKPDASGSRIPRIGKDKNIYLITSFAITVTNDELMEIPKIVSLELLRNSNENRPMLLSGFRRTAK
ncbi:MAG: hypothetical protein KA974_03690 [Saprospiraceae bacterium]|nr:hypothetical protein [Saprospiraceae bacterium]MBP7699517.1 hypothetical protein [Saprospiraceae bacterium]